MDGQHDTRDGSPKKIFNTPGLQYTKYPLVNIIILTGEDYYSQDRFPAIHPYSGLWPTKSWLGRNNSEYLYEMAETPEDNFKAEIIDVE